MYLSFPFCVLSLSYVQKKSKCWLWFEGAHALACPDTHHLPERRIVPATWGTQWIFEDWMSVVVGEKRYIEKGLVIRSRIESTRGLEVRAVEFRRMRIQPQSRCSEGCVRFIWGAFPWLILISLFRFLISLFIYPCTWIIYPCDLNMVAIWLFRCSF